MATFEEALTYTGFKEKLVSVNRVTKVVKGGRLFSFAALTVVGNGNGRVGFGYCKSKEVPNAIAKSYEQAKRNMIEIKLKKRTIHSPVTAKHGAVKIYLQPATEGTGLIAGGAMRAILECVGVHNVLAKCYGSRNPINVVRATIKGLQLIDSPFHASKRRGKKMIKNIKTEQT
ncbi:MAG: 30S ribosomal protein S5 [Methylacidiphilales bacterium]|nr:30S ribosomal protein S5 [Candidatus Methylacidiphilales bacterium]